MIVVHRRFGPKHSEYERVVFGSTSWSGHAGCWANDDCCGEPGCIMEDFDGEPTNLELAETSLRGESDAK